jgi:gamma-glutamylcyclotransferase (GGCT)/AIG2-like uncharacterized protein YtfP
MKQFLFTYGTLSTGQAPSSVVSLMKSLKRHGKGYIRGRLYDLGDFPGVVLSESPRNKVFGDIFELPTDGSILKQIDRYEEFSPRKPKSSLFVRKRVPVKLDNGEQIECWTYVYNGQVPRTRRISSGNYLAPAV